jgi:CRISPR/Cas system-associated exonuclease Cas4 (RecB family)
MTRSQSHKLEVAAEAELRLRIAREWIQAFPRDTEILLLAYSTEAAVDLQLSVVSNAGSWFGIKRQTLNSIAARLAQLSLVALESAPASRFSFIAVVARAIHALNSEGKLKYFAPVASKPGFPVAVARTLDELRMNQLGPEALKDQARGGPDLSAIAAEVDRQLKASRLADRATIFKSAIDSIDSTRKPLPLLLLDVAPDSRLESELIRKLAEHAPSVLATSPHGADRAIAALEKALNCTRNDHALSSKSTSLDLARQHLFQDSAPDESPLDETVMLQNWPGEPRECVEIVRNIQAEAASGVAFDQMAVLLNSPGEYRSHLEEAFTRAEIPAYFTQGLTTPDPAGRAMLALLACAADNLSAKRFAEYLSLGQVPEQSTIDSFESQWVAPQGELFPEVTESTATQSDRRAEPKPVSDDGAVIEGSLVAPARWERLLVESAVIGGVGRWEKRLNGLAAELELRQSEIKPEEEARVESINKQLRDLSALRKYALPLIERLSNLPGPASWGKWLGALQELAVHGLRTPENVLATLAELAPMAPVGPVDLHEVQLVLRTKLRDLAVKPQLRRYGAVFVGPVDAARGLSFQVVFVPGLAEKIFPRKIVDDPILTDEQRGALNGGRLIRRRDQLESERLGLRLALGAARERVYLSYPRIDLQQSRPRVPSFYALDVLRAAKGKLPGYEEVAAMAESVSRARLGWPAPQHPAMAIDDAEYDLALLDSLFTDKSEETTGRAHYLLSANRHLARALRGRSRRLLRRWTTDDGLVDPDELAMAGLASQQFSARSFSATALQNFASCPYRFFLSAILRLEMREEPAAIEVIDPLTRGSLFHETQFEVLTKLKSEGLLPLDISDLDRAFALVDEALDRLAAEYQDTLAPAIPRVWHDGINAIRADQREWLRRMADSTDGWIPDKFELSFGLSDRGPRDSDPNSVDEPVEIVGDLKLRGSIDLVERHVSGKYRVTDHKTGKARAEKNTIVGGGKHLQPLLYALACQKLMNQPVESGRLYYCTSDGGYQDRNVPLDEYSRETVTRVLTTVRNSLAEGFLPAAPEEDACVWCDFLAVCGAHAEARAATKVRTRLVQLERIRELP